MGIPRELSNVSGEICWQADYRAWGNTLQVTYPSQKEEEEPVWQPLRFQGQYFDAETGLHYNRFRYYDPDVGRFVSQDPIGLAGGVNLYSYAPNPLNWVDPLGLAAHRGRIQAQGTNLEESVSWNQDTPLTIEDAKDKIEELKRKLNKKDLVLRKEAFAKAEKFIEKAGKCGGVDAPVSKTSMVKDTKHERVDIEVISGKAFTE